MKLKGINAYSINGIQIDDTNIADEKALRYNATTGKLEYISLAERDTDAVENNLAKFNSDGDVVDLGKSDSDFVHTSGDETVTGIKNFAGSLQHNGINVAKIVTDTDGKWIVDENGVKSPLSNVELSELAEDYQAKGVSKPYIFIDSPSQDQTVDLDITPITWVNELGTDGEDLADSSSVNFTGISGNVYYETLDSTLITCDGTSETLTNSSGSTVDVAVYDLTKMGELPTSLASYFGKTNFEDLTASEVDEIAPGYINSVKTVGYSFDDGEYSSGIENKGRNIWDLGEVIATGTIVEPASYIGMIQCQPDTTYTISCEKPKGSNDNDRLFVYSSSYLYEGAWILYEQRFDTTYRASLLGATEASLTTGENHHYLLVFSYIQNGYAGEFSNIQLEEGSTATDYQPPSAHSETLPELWGYNGVFDSPDSKKWKRVKLVDAVNSAGVVDWSWTTSSGADCILLNIQEDSANYGENKVTVTGNTDDTGWAENDDVLVAFDNTGGEDNHIVDTYNGSTQTDSVELYQNPNPQLMIEHGKNHIFGDNSAYIYLQTAYNQYQLEREARERNNKLLEVEERNNGLWGNTRTGKSFLINPAIITQDSVGIYWDGSADPTCERTGVATNVSDFDLIYPFNQRRRVALDSSGNVVGIHSSFDTNFWQDGSAVDWATYETDGWNCMVQVPKFWYRQWKDSGGWHFQISAYPKSGFAIHPAFLNSNGTQRDYYYISAFEGWVDGDSKLRSLPNKQPSTSEDVTGTFTAFQGYATSAGLKLMDWNILWAEQLQFFIEINTLYSQDVYLGITNLDEGTVNHSQNTGHTLSLGNASGEVVVAPDNPATGETETETYPFSYRGHENLYGNVWKWVDGMVWDWNTGAPTITVGGTSYTLTDTHTIEEDGETTDFEETPGFMPKITATGSTSTYTTDYLWRTEEDDRIPRFSGYWANGGLAGGLSLNLINGASVSGRNFGGRAAL